MDEGFELPVRHNGKELLLPSQLVSFGWTHRINVEVYGIPVSYERDEEGQWRALVSAEDLAANKNIDVGLLEAIAHAIEEVLR